MADSIELYDSYSLLKDINTKSLQTEEITGRVAYSEIDGLFSSLSKESGNEVNTVFVPELEQALLSYNMGQLKRLMKEGAPYLYEAFNRHMPLEISAFYCRSDIIKIILERHTQEGQDCDQDTFQHHASLALYESCVSNSVKTARMLLEAGTPVLTHVHPHAAAQHGSWGVLSLIMHQQRIDIDERDEHCYTPLHYATQRGYAPTVAFLLACGADPNAACDLDGKTPLHLACESASEVILYLLVNNGAGIDLIDHFGRTAVLTAAGDGKTNAITILANAGANLDYRDRRGRTALIFAASNGHANVVRELITNGASLDVTDTSRFNALERGIMNRKDTATAMLIQLAPKKDFLQYYVGEIEVCIHKIVKFRMEKSVMALLDRMIIIDLKSHCIVNTKYLDLDIYHKTPLDYAYTRNAVCFLERVAEKCSDKVARHGVIRLLVDEKMKKFGYCILAFKLILYLMFIFALSYSLIQGALEIDPFGAYLDGGWNYFRIATESFVLLYFIVNVFTELVEILRVAVLTYTRLRDKRESEQANLERERSACEDQELCEDVQLHAKSDKSRMFSSLKNNLLLRVLVNYFKEQSNYLDIISLLSLAVLIPLRVSRQPIQWVFATISFLFNSLRLFNYINIIPILGPYSNIFYKIIIKDVPKFALMFLIALLIYSACFSIALRVPYSLQGLINKTFVENTTRENGINNAYIWVLLSGIRILLDGNVFESNYLFQNLNWLAAIVYLIFLFLTIVVFLNVFIAQLSDRYAKVRINAERSFAWHRLNFIVQIQKSSLLSLCIDFRKKFFIDKIYLDSDGCVHYFGTSNIGSYHSIALEGDSDEKGLLSQIKHQVEISRKTRDLTHTMKLMKSAPDEFGAMSPSTSIFRHEMNERMKSVERSISLLTQSREDINMN